MDSSFREAALEYHRHPRPGKMIDECDPDKLVEIIAALEPTFGGINLEDIKAPECFAVERALRERMRIPVFHDDQHGTAIVVAAAILNGLHVAGKRLDRIKLVCSGAGAAALSCLDLLVDLGIKREQVWVSDICGVVFRGRLAEMDERKALYAQETSARTLAELLQDADVFLGLSAGGVLKPTMLPRMAGHPLSRDSRAGAGHDREFRGRIERRPAVDYKHVR